MFGARVSVPVWALAVTVLFVFFQGTLLPLNALTSSSQMDVDHHASGLWRPFDIGSVGHRLLDESNVPVPKREDGSSPMSLEERVRYLELKTNAFMNFGSDPLFGSKPRVEEAGCEKVSNLVEFGCKEGWEGWHGDPSCRGLFDHRVCLDDLPTPREWDIASNEPKGNARAVPEGDDPPCLIYDFGIREQPQFGVVMARIFGCEVHAFDPSPIAKGWWNGNQAHKIRALPNYHFHPYGSGGIDGDLELMEYDWGQVSIIRFPTSLVDCGDSLEGNENCNVKPSTDFRKTFTLPVKTLNTIRRELGHENRTIDMLKVDVEGSEYAFLEAALDRGGGGLPRVNQLTLEWHHMPWDPRYGEGSSPPINAIVTLLDASGLKLFWQSSVGGWPSNIRAYQRMGLKDIRYNLASFMRKKK